jgi:hypothetical protein
MALEQFFDTVNDAPEYLRSALTEEDGKFVFRAEPAAAVQSLKDALKKEREAAKNAAKALKNFDGIDPEEYRALKESRETAEAEKARASGDWSLREQQLKAELERDLSQRQRHYETERETWEAERALLLQNLQDALITSSATQAITQAKGIVPLLMPLVQRQARLAVGEDGTYRVEVLDSQGNPRIADIKGTPFTLDRLIDEMKADPVYGRAFEATGAGGSGAQNGNKSAGNGKAITRAAFDGMDPAAKMQFIKGGGIIQ